MEMEIGRLSIDSDLLMKLGLGLMASSQAILIAYFKNKVDKQKRDLDFAFGVLRGWNSLDKTRKKQEKKR